MARNCSNKQIKAAPSRITYRGKTYQKMGEAKSGTDVFPTKAAANKMATFQRKYNGYCALVKPNKKGYAVYIGNRK